MRAKHPPIPTTVSLLLLSASIALLTGSCAVPPGGPFLGLGPPFDQLFGLLLAVGLVMLGIYARQKFLRQKSIEGSGGSKPSSAEEIARERYARGELTRDEFFRILTDLTTPHGQRR